MFEIWRHAHDGERFLVLVRDGKVNAVAGPLREWENPRQVLETHSNQNHNPYALLNMRAAPHEYVREYTADHAGHITRLPDLPAP